MYSQDGRWCVSLLPAASIMFAFAPVANDTDKLVSSRYHSHPASLSDYASITAPETPPLGGDVNRLSLHGLAGDVTATSSPCLEPTFGHFSTNERGGSVSGGQSISSCGDEVCLSLIHI